ncbi:MAG: ATP-binding cassette domain-containing protein [Planctomycetota bacterium]|jgi:molybdate/tungstate transport system ATP-binding protein
MLELQSISKTLASFAMPDISIKIDDGEYFVLLGPSGVGKSVLIEIVAGLIKPDNGQILWNRKDMTLEPPETRGFAVVYQDYALFPHLTVRQNIIYGLRAAGCNSTKIKARLNTLAEMLQIEELLSRQPATLSGGEQQRVALARALIVEPKLLLLDEPLSALDINTRLRLRKELKRVNRELNISVLHVTHDPEEAMVLADQICVMLDSKIRQVAPPTELFRRPSDPEVAAFLATRNVLPVSKAQEGVCSICEKNIYVSSADVSTSHVWIKPEEILLSTSPFDSSARNQFKSRVVEIEPLESLLAVHIVAGKLPLTALITYTSFNKLQLKAGTEVYATFKSSAIHCF